MTLRAVIAPLLRIATSPSSWCRPRSPVVVGQSGGHLGVQRANCRPVGMTVASWSYVALQAVAHRVQQSATRVRPTGAEALECLRQRRTLCRSTAMGCGSRLSSFDQRFEIRGRQILDNCRLASRPWRLIRCVGSSCQLL